MRHGCFYRGRKNNKKGTIDELMENEGNEHILKLTLEGSVNGIISDLQLNFPNFRIKPGGNNSCFISSVERPSLLPILQYLDKKGFLYMKPGNPAFIGRCICKGDRN